jgi:hypothetical protein
MRKANRNGRETPTGDTLSASKRFRRYNHEKPAAEREAEIEKSKTLLELEGLFKQLPSANIESIYGESVILIRQRRLDYNEGDVERFSLALGDLKNTDHFSNKAGAFLSALVNHGKDDGYVIHTSHLDSITCLGIYNTKEIEVIGQAGWSLATNMIDGRITVVGGGGRNIGSLMQGGEVSVIGDCHTVGMDMRNGKISIVGNAKSGQIGTEMKGGEISIRGDVGDHLGMLMKGGKITIYGNAGGCIGHQMEGGEIHLMGGRGSIDEDFRGGRIFHKGKLIAGE